MGRTYGEGRALPIAIFKNQGGSTTGFSTPKSGLSVEGDFFNVSRHFVFHTLATFEKNTEELNIDQA